MKKFLAISFIVFSSGLASAQLDSSLYFAENKLEILLNDLRSAKGNEAKESANIKFKEELRKAIELPGAMIYPFARLRTMGKITSPDYLVRLFTWNIELDNHHNLYHCLILRYDESKKEFQISELIDDPDMSNSNPVDIIEADNWYGALYYQLIPFDKGSRTMYAVLGWDGYSTATNRKLIDVLYFSGKNPKLGSPVFKVGKETFKRIFYEHSENATMSLKYDEANERILFEHLSPESPALAGFYAYYVPDMSYDAFVEKNGKWYLQEDVIAVNKRGEEKIVLRYGDEKDGEKIKTAKMKNAWIDPTDKNAPNQGTPHIARKPGEENTVIIDGKEEKVKKETKIRHSKDKRDPSTMYPYNELKKKPKRRKKRN